MRAWIGAHLGWLGLTGAVLMLVGGSWYQALSTPPYRFVDEQAHVGYVIALQEGRLPEIDTPIDTAGGGEALADRLADEPAARHTIWVANNPPLTYLVAAGPGGVTRFLGISGGPLLGLRLANVAAAGAAVALTYLLARDLSGGDRTVALVAAGLMAATPHLGFVAALGFNDGMALLATTGVLLALARVCGAGSLPPRRAVVHLGIWCAVAAASRPMALVFAIGAGALGGVVMWWRRNPPLRFALPWLAGPSMIAAGWYYIRNQVLYGDPTGSSTLFEKFGRQPSGSLWSTLTLKGMWESTYRTILTRRLEVPLPADPYLWYQVAVGVGIVAVIAAVALVARAAMAQRGGRHGDLAVLAWAAMGVMTVIPVLLTAQHRAGGGAPHPRYLFALLPVFVACVALATVRLGTRWSGAAAVVALAAATTIQTARSIQWLTDNPKGPAGSQLVEAYGDALTRGAGIAVAAIGLVLVVGAIVWPDPTASSPRR